MLLIFFIVIGFLVATYTFKVIGLGSIRSVTELVVFLIFLSLWPLVVFMLLIDGHWGD